MTSIHHRTITACIMAQRLLGVDPLARDFYPPIEMKRIMARIRITEEAWQTWLTLVHSSKPLVLNFMLPRTLG